MKKTIKELYGITSYPSYGGGSGIYRADRPNEFVEKTFGFKLHRHFCDNFRFHFGNPDNPAPNGDGRLMVQRSAQGFFTDDYFRLLKDNGIKNIWCSQGRMGFQDAQGTRNKINPVADGADRMDPASWADAAEFHRQLAIRYASDTAAYLGQAKVVTDGVDGYLINEPKAGLGLVDAIEIGNEWNFPAEWSKGKATLTPEEYAVFFKACYDAIRSVSNIEVIMGGGLGGQDNLDYISRFLDTLDDLYGIRLRNMPTDFYLCFHWYMRDGGAAQGSGIRGASPEEIDAYGFGKQMDSLCTTWGLPGWYCTETGWSAAADGSQDTSKNSAPIQEGFTQLESQGLLMNRLVAAWAACDKCQGVTFWHCRDNYDAGPFANGGVNGPDWNPKPARDIAYSFIEDFGVTRFYDYRQGPSSGHYYVTDGNGNAYNWADGLGNGSVNGAIQPVVSVPPVIPPIEPPTMVKLAENDQGTFWFEPK